ncbi:alkaline shock protein [Ligilactobacillus hayakitensis DSM 18933 = JCM 14209]|uniref:Alkaline shock protein n=1 Tax=Ligilactobacillus hayakitensis DSM 18933 = JCM 14209 TaxID=1423755 RepID=A0A0R1WMW4_9LACO|nr:Asp23/Gls24 family envelope stress response protein [Ligilactobacillus hayakitensis]KRM18773.1 alkaline shock protein [Ligilactobacillus hayakitensis DSM 18933 = JCM 14209]
MADDNNIVLNSEPGLGRVEIAPQVIELIISIAASKVDGVYSMRGSLTKSISNLFRKTNRSTGVKLDNNSEVLKVDVYAYLNYGVSVPKVAEEIQEKVRQQLLFMTGLDLVEVDVHVEGIVPEKQEQSVDLNNLFDEEVEGE